MKPFKFILLLGKSGSGKGTQAELLAKQFHLKYLSSGTFLRARAEKHDFIGKKLREIMARGALIPTPVVFHIWLHAFEAIRKNGSFQGLVFEGSPRKLYEAYMLDEVLQFYGWDKELHVFQIMISDTEAMKRLLLRARSDDQKKAIRNRLSWYQQDVKPVISFYRKKGVLVRINGEQSIEKIHKDIAKTLE